MSSLFPHRFRIKQTPPNELQLLSIDDDDAEEVFSTLSSTTTRTILAALYKTPQTASDISDEVDTSLQNTTYHLEKLQGANLIEIVDTWYSDSGREMKVYAPTNASLVLFATEAENERPLRESVLRLVGSIALLGLVSRLIDHLSQAFRDPQNQDVQVGYYPDITSPGTGATNAMLHLSPGELFFLVGLLTILLASAWKYYIQGHMTKTIRQQSER